MLRTLAELAFAGSTIVVVLMGLDNAAKVAAFPTIPACQEDQVLVGSGDFEAGRWSAYDCGPAVDDYVR